MLFPPFFCFAAISIHALLAESDLTPIYLPANGQNFYPRSPCGERPRLAASWQQGLDFYPRSPCGERPGTRCQQHRHPKISIHALLAESDFIWRQWRDDVRIFLSTLSLRRATDCTSQQGKVCKISIHALLAESDMQDAGSVPQEGYFYPRSPCGERPAFLVFCARVLVISIHALLAESDRDMVASTGSTQISIHALLAESDMPTITGIMYSDNFYPRSPCGERPYAAAAKLDRFQFLSTLSLRRATLLLRYAFRFSAFLSTLSLRRATS